MSSRFHNKWHRHNHHTYKHTNEPDSGHDPVASPIDPFLGDFVLHGALTAYAPLSSFAGSFYSNSVSLSAGSLSGTAAKFFAPVSNYGPFTSTNAITGFNLKALVVDGYAQFNAPAWFYSIYTKNFFIDTFTFDVLSGNSVYTDYLFSARNAHVINLTAENITNLYTTELTANYTTLSGDSIWADELVYTANCAVGVRNSSYTISPSSWTLCPLVSGRYDPYTYFTSGALKPTTPGLYSCELTMTAHALSSTPLAIVAGVTTNTAITAMAGGDPDAYGPFTGAYFGNNGVTYTNSQGVSGVMIQGSTLVSVNGLNEAIGVYVLNTNGNSVVDYARLRIVYQGSII